MNIQIDLATLTHYGDLVAGQTYPIAVVVKGDESKYIESGFSNEINYSVPSVYTITNSLTHITASGGNPSTMTAGSSVSLTYNANTGYTVPVMSSGVTVSNATLSNYTRASDGSSCTFTISNPTGNVSITITGTAKVYGITYNLTNISGISIPIQISTGGSVTVTLQCINSQGYEVPQNVSDITVTNATISNYSTSSSSLTTICSFTLSNPTGAVTVTAAGVKFYTITTTLSHITASGSNPSKMYTTGTTYLSFTANTGYNLPSSITVSGASYTWNSASGQLGLSNPTANVTVTITGELITIDNLMNTATYKQGIVIAGGSNAFSQSTTLNGVFYIPITVGQQYTVVKNLNIGAVMRVAYSAAIPAGGGAVTNYTEGTNGVAVMAAAPSGANYLVFQVHGGSTDGDIHENMANLMSVWEGSDTYGYSVTVTAGVVQPSGVDSELKVKLNNAPASETDYTITTLTDPYGVPILKLTNGATQSSPMSLQYITNLYVWQTGYEASIEINGDSYYDLADSYDAATNFTISANTSVVVNDSEA